MLLFSCVAGLLLVESAKANPVGQLFPFKNAPFIIINSDGSITPDTGLISRSGSTYALTANVSDFTIAIECSNIIFDGNGHNINVTPYEVYDESGLVNYTANFQSYGISLGNYPDITTNVIVKNVEITSSWRAISMFNCSNCQITGVKTKPDNIRIDGDSNTVTNCTAYIYIQGSGNMVFENNISDIGVLSGEANFIFLNNIFDSPDTSFYYHGSNFWDNGSVGNFWSNYASKYSNASEIGFTGLGNTPYVIDSGNVDHHPLMYPYDIENDKIALPNREPFPILPVVVVSGASVFIVSAGLVVYFKKRGGRRNT